MEAVREFQKKICSHAMLAALAGAVILLILGEKAVGKGLVLGTLFSVVNFVLMAQLLPLSVGSSSRSKASAAALGSILFRFALLAVPLVISIRSESIHIFGVVPGLFMVQLALLFDHLAGGRTTFPKNT
ncbi:MAG: ATP synthase subunit I [Desulfobacteraceae bacterium]